jgi:UTP--glucose-1-phosphate uridylyltransferase
VIKKAIIPVAGLASRFLPASKVIPKTMFPIIDKPIIQFLVEEAVEAGIEEIAIILSPRQDIVKNHFKEDEFLEQELRSRGKTLEAETVHSTTHLAKIHFFTQEHPLGDGHALLQAESFLDENEACLVLFGDELIGTSHERNASAQLIKYYNDVQTPIIGVHEVSEEEVHRYGIVGLNEETEINSLVEKPSPGDAPSNLAIIGKYIINSEVLRCIKESSSGTTDKELRLIDGLKTYLESKNIHALTLDGQRFDTGNKLGLIKANIYFGLKDKDITDSLKNFLRTVEK